MQVNSVNQSPNFGMAMRIKPEALDTLKKMSRSEVEQLQRVAEELKNTKYYHLEVGEGGKRTVVSPYANTYKGGTFQVLEPNDEFLKFNATWAGHESGKLKPGDTYNSCIKFTNKEAAQKAYADLRKSAYGVESDAKMIKYLDAREIEKDAEAAAQSKERQEIAAMVDDLFAKYSAQ